MASSILGRRGREMESEAWVEQELRQANRHMRDFLSVLGHELCNPLAAIRYALCMLEERGDDSVKREWVRRLIERQAHSISSLVDGLLDVSRIEHGKVQLSMQTLDLSSVVAQAVETVLPFVEAFGHQIEVKLPMEGATLEADPVRLGQVLTNLLNNAAKYTEPGGRIWLTANVDGGDVVLQVRDNGIGIASEMLSKVFDPFWQGVYSHGGLGIGLALVKKLTELHGGSATARSDGLGRGSEFTVRLPRCAGGVNGQRIDTDGSVNDLPS